MKDMKLTRIFFLVFFSLFLTTTVSAQKSTSTNADNAVAKGDYYDAIALYKKAYSKEKNKAKKAEIVYKIAECYTKTNNPKDVEAWYAKAIKAGYKENDVVFKYAEALKLNGKYDEAIVQFNKYKQSGGTAMADAAVKEAEQAQKWKDKPNRYKVENLAVLNTKYSDFAAAYSSKDKRKIIYCSARAEATGKATDGGTGEKFQDLFEASVDKKGKWSAPKALLAPVNGESNEGAATFDAKGNDMFFTRCPFDKGKVGSCEIYFTKRKGQTWDEPKMIPLGADSATVGQPSLSLDEQTLYFVSDMNGGQGGKDIWMSKWNKSNKAWSEPVNLGTKINTAGDEMFPFIAPDGKSFYFASNGHKGMGGLDIFTSKINGESFDEPQNMRYPINSSFDDFAYVVEDSTSTRGFLSSNRDGGKGSDDLYTWTLPPLIFTLSGKVTDSDTKALLPGAKVELFGSDGTSIPVTVDNTATYRFDLKPEVSYRVVASMTDYLSKQLELTTVGLEVSKDFIGDFDFALKSTKKPIELPNILYDLGRWELRSESKVALDGLVKTMNDNPTIVIEIGSHTDSRPIPMTNDTLSQRRAQSVVDYLIEKGIDPDRLYAKGYGEKEPRTLDTDMGAFKKGDRLTDGFINAIKNTKEREAAHQLNRRTEFKVLRSNFVKGQKAVESPSQIEIIKEEAKVEAPVVEVPKVEAPKEPGKIHTVAKGDTYNTIAKKYGLVLKDLKTLNGIKAEPITEGMDLKVEMGGDYAAFDAKFYTLEKDDDSWSKVAKKLNVKVADLKKLNKGLDDDMFRAGKKIRKEQ
ncbi:MAG: hypothetical protein RIQ89_2242 [Bacteroidota bacterium]